MSESEEEKLVAQEVQKRVDVGYKISQIKEIIAALEKIQAFIRDPEAKKTIAGFIETLSTQISVEDNIPDFDFTMLEQYEKENLDTAMQWAEGEPKAKIMEFYPQIISKQIQNLDISIQGLENANNWLLDNKNLGKDFTAEIAEIKHIRGDISIDAKTVLGYRIEELNELSKKLAGAMKKTSDLAMKIGKFRTPGGVDPFTYKASAQPEPAKRPKTPASEPAISQQRVNTPAGSRVSTPSVKVVSGPATSQPDVEGVEVKGMDEVDPNEFPEL